MTKLSSVQFAMWEMRVYLDTHNGNEEAHRLYKNTLPNSTRSKQNLKRSTARLLLVKTTVTNG